MIRILAATILLSGCVTSSFFGVASLKDDGEICLQIRSEERGFPVAETYRCYKPDDPQYAMIREHVGPIAVGKEKRIAPFK